MAQIFGRPHADDGDDNLGTCEGVERPARVVIGAGDIPGKISSLFILFFSIIVIMGSGYIP